MAKTYMKLDGNLVPVSVGTAETSVAPQGETWVLNETLNQTEINIQINFTAGVLEPLDFTELLRYYLPKYFINKLIYIEAITQNDIPYFDNGSWVNPDYRTITFETAPTGELLTWLQANAVNITGDVVELTQVQYDALPVYDDNTYYLIVEDE